MARAKDLAGLAALAGIGYSILKDKKGESDVTDLAREKARAERGPVAVEDFGPDYEREIARASRGLVGVGAQKARTSSGTAKPASKPETTSDATVNRGSGRGLAEAQTQLRDYRERQARDLESGTSRGRPAEGEIRQTTGATYPRPKPMTREEAIASIPSTAPEGWQGGTGDRVTGNEFTRNVVPLAVMSGPGMSIVGNAARLMPATRAAQTAAQAEREAVLNPLNWMAGRGGDLARKAMSEADTAGGAIGYRKGGKAKASMKTESKSTVKGWGAARGARKAKIY